MLQEQAKIKNDLNVLAGKARITAQASTPKLSREKRTLKTENQRVREFKLRKEARAQRANLRSQTPSVPGKLRPSTVQE